MRSYEQLADQIDPRWKAPLERLWQNENHYHAAVMWLAIDFYGCTPLWWRDVASRSWAAWRAAQPPIEGPDLDSCKRIWWKLWDPMAADVAMLADVLFSAGEHPKAPSAPKLRRSTPAEEWFELERKRHADMHERLVGAKYKLLNEMLRQDGTGGKASGVMTLRQIWQERANGKHWHGIRYKTLKRDRYNPSRRDSFPKPKVATGRGSGSGNLYDPDEIEEYVKNRPDRRSV